MEAPFAVTGRVRHDLFDSPDDPAQRTQCACHRSQPMSTSNTTLVPRIEGRIQVIRGLRIIIDADLAELYGVPTKVLNQAVKRNAARFPPDFMFQLDTPEKAEVVTNCDHLHKLKFSKALPHAFTEYGAVALANVLASAQAVEMGIYVVRAFVQLRQVFETLRELADKVTPPEPPQTPKRSIGFLPLERTTGPRGVPRWHSARRRSATPSS